MAGPARLHGTWLTVARITWVALALCAVVGFVANLPNNLNPQRSLCDPPATPCMLNMLLPEEVALLPQIGLSLSGYHFIISLSDSLLFAGMWLIVSALIFWRKSDDRMAVLTALMMIGFPFSLAGGVPSDPVLILLGGFVRLFSNILAGLFFLFPTGTFVPRWTRWVVYGFFVWSVVWGFLLAAWVFTNGADTQPTGIMGALTNIAPFIFFGVFLLSVGCQVYRYWRVSNTAQRQQTKWIFISILTLPALDLLVRGVVMPSLFPELFKPGVTHIVYNLISNPFFVAGFFLVPIAFAVSIFRYHLYAIDLIIRRTLVYSAFTAALAIVYFSSVALLQQLSRIFTGQQPSEIITVVSTLVIAVLFVPLRNHVQTLIDQRFYRRKYDAARTVAAFGTAVRDEVDLDTLRQDLLAVVQETMQPAHVSLWLYSQPTDYRSLSQKNMLKENQV